MMAFFHPENLLEALKVYSVIAILTGVFCLLIAFLKWLVVRRK